MVDFNSDIPNGRPQLDANYWKNLHKPEPQQNGGVFDVNTNFASLFLCQKIYKKEPSKFRRRFFLFY